MQNMREKCANELERVVQCREMARCAWRHNPSKDHGVNDARLHSLAQFNEVIVDLKEAIATHDQGLIARALDLAERTP